MKNVHSSSKIQHPRPKKNPDTAVTAISEFNLRQFMTKERKKSQYIYAFNAQYSSIRIDLIYFIRLLIFKTLTFIQNKVC